MPLVAKIWATSCWPSPSRCTATCGAAATVGQLDEPLSRQKETSGGRSDTEVNDVAVNPTGGSPAAVTTVTVAACRRNSARNCAESSRVDSEIVMESLLSVAWQ